MSSSPIEDAVDALNRGEVIAYPTEGVWGIGCDPANELAVRRILEIKKRPIEKGMIVVADTVARLAPYISDLPAQQQLTKDSQPTTWLVEHGGKAPFWITGGSDKLAVRISDHPVIRQLCIASGLALVSTSANPAGFEPARSEADIRGYFHNLIDVIVPGALGGQDGASEIRDLASGDIIRAR